jgi:hypothetical protein
LPLVLSCSSTIYPSNSSFFFVSAFISNKYPMLSSVWWGYVSQMRKNASVWHPKLVYKKHKKKEKKEKEHTINRWTNVLFSCPIRCTRLTAWASAAGLSSGSTRTTCCASKRLGPLAPCWIKSSNTGTDFVTCCCLWVLLGLLYPVSLILKLLPLPACAVPQEL